MHVPRRSGRLVEVDAALDVQPDVRSLRVGGLRRREPIPSRFLFRPRWPTIRRTRTRPCTRTSAHPSSSRRTARLLRRSRPERAQPRPVRTSRCRSAFSSEASSRRSRCCAGPLSIRYRAVTVRLMLEFGILGPIAVADERGPIRLGGPKQRATLAILLLGANRVVPVERLADDLYGGAAPVTAVTQVQRQVSELRRLLGDASAIETRSPGYVIRIAPGSSICIASSVLRTGPPRSVHEETRRRHRRFCSTLLRYGEVARWPISRTSRSRAPRSSGSRRFGLRRSSDGSTPSSFSAGTRSSSASYRSLSRPIPSASGSGSS